MQWPNSPFNYPASPLPVFNDVETEEEKVKYTRKKYWPNDSHNDASNPIQVFEDMISISSDSIQGGGSYGGSKGSESSQEDKRIV